MTVEGATAATSPLKPEFDKAPSRPLAAMTSSGIAWRREVGAGAIASILSLPVFIASGVLVFAPLGPGYIATGATAGLVSAIVAGAVSGLVATSSFIITTPRVSESLVLASLIIALMAKPGVANDKSLIITAVFVCVLLGGAWQCVFGLAGVAKVIKFTPHPVLVGFLNGVAVLVLISQVKPFFAQNARTSDLVLVDRPGMAILLAAVVALVLSYPLFSKRLPGSRFVTKIPAVVIGFVCGIAAYYVCKAIDPNIDLGPTLGSVQLTLSSPLAGLRSVAEWHAIGRIGWDIIVISAILAIVATLDALLAFRSAQNVSDLQLSPVRDLIAQGAGNCAAAIAGGITGAASPSSTMGAYRAGGRTRVAQISSSVILLAVGVFLPQYLAKIPSVVLSGILLCAGIGLFDRWTFQLVTDVRKAATPLNRRRALYDFLVVIIVMGVTIFYSVVAGVLAGCLLAGTIFVMNMSRPMVRRSFSGSEIQSKRVRPVRDVTLLRETGAERAVLQLEGVLFFGNADDLSARVKNLFKEADAIALDMRGVSDIDVSGANTLTNLLSKSREVKKDLLFCEVPPAHNDLITGLVRRTVGDEEPIKHDLDSALEWMEEKSLRGHADRRSQTDILSFAEIDFLAGIEERDLERLREVLKQREFAAAEIICREGDDGDRMWLLAKGSVSIRLALPDGRGYRRIASLARGTTIGEMSLVEAARRSATIVADEPVICYELLRSGFDSLLAECPLLATKLLGNLSRELARRLRKTSEDLRNLS